MLRSTLIPLATLMILSACSGGGAGGGDRPFPAGDALTADYPSVVGDESFSEGMGLLLVKKSGSLGVCTSFMVSPTELATNSHCLENISLTESCNENVVVHVKTASGYVFRRCQRIKTKSHITGDFLKPDFALIELDAPTSMTPKILSREGVEEGTELTVESVDWAGDSKSIYGHRKVSQCRPMAHAVIGNFTRALSSIIPLFGDFGSSCKVIQGNSGSPIYNSSRRVVSVLFATLDRDAIRRRMRVESRNAALATNLACLRTGIRSFDALRSSECERVIAEEASYGRELSARVSQGSRERRAQRAELLRLEQPTAFEFELKEKVTSQNGETEKYSYSFNPKCMKSPAGWSQTELLKVRATSEGKRRYSTTVGDYTLGVSTTYDDYLRPKPSLELKQTSYYELIVEDVDAGSPVTLKIATKDSAGIVTLTEQVVSHCQNI